MTPPPAAPPDEMGGSVLGNPVRRREDPHLVTGNGRYVDDVRLEGALFAAFLRSPLAHARVVRVDTAAAEALPGVVGVFTDESLGLDMPLTPEKVWRAIRDSAQ